MSDSFKNILLVLFSFLFALIVAEIVLAALDMPPRQLKPHSAPTQFVVQPDKSYGYVNLPSSQIEFIYDGNPRNYFGERNEVVYETNSLGFRGAEWPTVKHEGGLRIAFMGDSFTFGEGVHYEDIFPTITQEELRARNVMAESLNFGVGGYNTLQSSLLLQPVVTEFSPDVVVLGYTINDAEPPLIYYDKARGEVVREPREKRILKGFANATVPDLLLFKLRTARLIYQYLLKKNQAENTIGWYQSLYNDENIHWGKTQEGMLSISMQCRQHNMRCIVVVFPLLYRLDNYPLQAEHELVINKLQQAGYEFIDLLPLLEGREAETLWVHPTDQHPNEIVHRIVAEALVEKLIARDKRQLPARNHE